MHACIHSIITCCCQKIRLKLSVGNLLMLLWWPLITFLKSLWSFPSIIIPLCAVIPFNLRWILARRFCLFRNALFRALIRLSFCGLCMYLRLVPVAAHSYVQWNWSIQHEDCHDISGMDCTVHSDQTQGAHSCNVELSMHKWTHSDECSGHCLATLPTPFVENRTFHFSLLPCL